MAESKSKAAANKTAASNKEAAAETKVSATADVTNANENPEFSKIEKGNGEATDTRVSQLGESVQVGASKQTPDADTAAREQQLAEREKALDDREAKIAEREAGKVKEAPKGHSFTFEKQKYKFVDHAPKKIRVDGKQLTQEEIAKDEEALLHLIGGQSSLIQKI